VHGWHVRREPQVLLTESPEASLRRLYYDTILHARPALEFLIGSVGADHVLLGSDYPFDMGTQECVRQVRALAIPQADRDTVLGGLARSLLGHPADASRRSA
jgi:aminocarboxymuconate-semialdehyde decarboxylase